MPGVVACSAAMQETVRVIRRVADTLAPVLITGEAGVGKCTIAAAIHRLSRRAARPLVHVHVGGIAAESLARELFGSESHPVLPSPSEASAAPRGDGPSCGGRFADALGGTMFLEEIDRLPLVLQARLARVLGEEDAVGDVRLIAASRRDLRAEVEAGRFREDLYWRLNVVPVEIPPLRDRIEDIPPLVDRFLERSSNRNGRRVSRVRRDALDALEAYPWPGNVHELQAMVERAVVMAEGDELSLDLLPEAIGGIAPVRSGRLSRFDVESLTQEVVAQGIAAVAEDDPNPGLHSRIVDSVERELMVQVLRGCNGVRTQAAARLGINRNTLHKKIKDYGLDTESPDAAGS